LLLWYLQALQLKTQDTYKTKDRITRTPLKTGDELRCCGRVSSSCSTSDTRRVNLVIKPVISHERGKDREVFIIKWKKIPQIAPLVSSSSSIETIQYHALLHCHIIICSDLVVCLLRCTASW
jgi:hypothetical protein